MEIITLVLLIFILLLCLWKVCLLEDSYRGLGNKIPGKKPWPIVGNAIDVMLSRNLIERTWEEWKKRGNVFRLWFGNHLYVFLIDPEDIEVFLSSKKHIEKCDSYRVLKSWLGNGLMNASADKWRATRKILTPTFHFKILEDSIPIFIRNATILATILEKEVDSSDFDIQHYIEKCSLDIIYESAMGISPNIQFTQDSEFFKHTDAVNLGCVQRGASLFLQCDLIFRFSSIGRRYNTAVEFLKRTGRQAILKRREALTKEMSTTEKINSSKEGIKKPTLFLDLLLTGNFSNEEIEDEVQTFLFGGHHTTATSIMFCLYLLSQHQEIQNKAAEEIKNILSVETVPTLYNIAKMKYLEKVIKESMRIYPTVPLFGRKVAEDTVLPSGYTLPSGSSVIFPLFITHNREDLFPDPDRFDPDRFDNTTDWHPFSYIPFGAGIRNCIGQKFGMIEMKVILSILLMKYTFLPVEKPLLITFGITLRSLNGIPVKITRRL